MNGYYVIHLNANWHSEPYATAADAQAWIDGYHVTPAYKEANYRVVPVDEYWAKRGFPNGHPLLRAIREGK